MEDTAVQLTWASLPDGPCTIAAGERTVEVDGGPAPGAAVIDGLPPGEPITVTLAAEGRRPVAVERLRTLHPPPGAELFRFATLNDLHIGARKFGLLRPFRDRPGAAEPHPLRCARAAIAEAVAWGAQRLVVKGDITHDGRPPEWEQAAALLGAAPVPVTAVPGNHDEHRGSAEGDAAFADAGIELVDDIAHLDVPGLRIVALDTVVDEHHHGRYDHAAADLVALVGDAPGAAFVAMHHYPQRFPLPNIWPPGVPAPESIRFLDAVAEANPATFLSSGHTHRHRRHRHGSLTVTEVGATKDYPGTWAGYVVHEGGIRQVVRRVAAPEAIAWTERTRRVLGGIWGWWAEWHRHHRCFGVAWPER